MHLLAPHYHSAFLSLYIMDLMTTNSPLAVCSSTQRASDCFYAQQNFTNVYSVCIEAPVLPANVCKLPLKDNKRGDTSQSLSAAGYRGLIPHQRRGVCILGCITAADVVLMNMFVWLCAGAVCLTIRTFRKPHCVRCNRRCSGGPTCCSLTCVLLLKWVKLGSKSLLDNKVP